MDGRSAKRRRGDAYRKTKGPVKIAGRSSRLRFRVRARCTLPVLSPSPRLLSSLLVSLSSLFFFFLSRVFLLSSPGARRCKSERVTRV